MKIKEDLAIKPFIVEKSTIDILPHGYSVHHVHNVEKIWGINPFFKERNGQGTGGLVLHVRHITRRKTNGMPLVKVSPETRSNAQQEEFLAWTPTLLEERLLHLIFFIFCT